MYIHGVGERDGYKAPRKREEGREGEKGLKAQKKTLLSGKVLCARDAKTTKSINLVSRGGRGGEEIIVLRNESNSREEMEKEEEEE